ncbi:MAG: hypothetical protein ACF8NJ_06580 [Phycisphaerales bacterium JB038]
MRRTARTEANAQRHHRRGAILHLAVTLTALGVVTALATISATRTLRELNGELPTSPVFLDEGPTPQQVELELMRIGLDPETLACAGCLAQDVTTLVGNAQRYLTAGYDALRAAQVEYENAKFTRDKLSRIVRGGTATQEQIDALAAAETDLASKTAARDAARDALFDAAVDDLDPGELTAINTIKSHGRWRYPTYYKTVVREHADSIALRDALAHVRINPEYSLPVDPAAQQLIDTELAKPAVAGARTARDARIADIKSAWETALGL